MWNVYKMLIKRKGGCEIAAEIWWTAYTREDKRRKATIGESAGHVQLPRPGRRGCGEQEWLITSSQLVHPRRHKPYITLAGGIKEPLRPHPS